MDYCERCEEQVEETIEVKTDFGIGVQTNYFCEPCLEALSEQAMEDACRWRHSA